MSYILDALKKSERQRPPGPVPDLFSVQGPQPPQKSRLPAAPLTVSLVAGCAVVLAVWAWLESGGSRGDAPPVSAPPREAVVPVSDGVPPAAPPPAPPPLRPGSGAAKTAAPRVATPAGRPPARIALGTAAPPPDLSAAAPPPAPAPVPTPTLAPPAPAAPPAGSAVTAPSTDAPAPSAEGAPAASAVLPVREPAPAPGASAPPLPDSPEAPPQPADAASPVPVAPVDAPDPAPPDDRVVDLAELPAAIRGKLPELGISGHVWSEEAALRLLTVQDRIVREGGEAAPGVRLEQITQSGAVFVFRGWRFSLAAF